jgi:hypothetical protein
MNKKRSNGGLTHVSSLLPGLGIDVPDAPPAPPEVPAYQPKPVSKRRQNRDERITKVRTDRDDGKQDVGYLPKGFVLCGLPFKPVKNATYYERSNGDYVLEITGSPKYGLPFGADILPVIWVATLARKQMLETKSSKCPREISFKTGSQILDAFGLPKSGDSYRRMQERILRVFHATYFYGKAGQGRVTNYSFRFFDGVDLWFTHDLESQTLPGDDFANNRIELSEKFAQEIERNPPPIDLQMARAWSDKPAVLFFGMWLAYRCFTETGTTDIPLMGARGLKAQMGVQGYDDPKRGAIDFRKRVKGWLLDVIDGWPECPARIESRATGDYLTIAHAKAINQQTKGQFLPQKA